jgi:hypothetical protein
VAIDCQMGDYDNNNNTTIELGHSILPPPQLLVQMQDPVAQNANNSLKAKDNNHQNQEVFLNC